MGVPLIWTEVSGTWACQDSMLYLVNDSSASKDNWLRTNFLLPESYTTTVDVRASGGDGWEFRFNVEDKNNFYACQVEKLLGGVHTFTILSVKDGSETTYIQRLDNQIVGEDDYTTLSSLTISGQQSTHTIQILGNTVGWTIKVPNGDAAYIGGANIPTNEQLPSGFFAIGGTRDAMIGAPLHRFDSIAFSNATPTLFVKGFGSGIQNVTLLLKAIDQVQVIETLSMVGHSPENSGISLVLPESIASGVTGPLHLATEGKLAVEINASGLINLYTGGKTDNASGLMNLTLIVPTSRTVSGVMNLTLLGKAIVGTSATGTLDLFLAQSGSDGRVNLFIGSSGGTAGMIPGSSNMNLFLNRIPTDMVTLHMIGTEPTPASGLIDLYIGAVEGISTDDMDLFVFGVGRPTDNTNLYTHGF